MKITRSRLLGICSCYKHNKSVDIREILVSVRFELLNVAHKRYKSCIFRSACLWFTDHTHSAGHVLMMRLRMLELDVGRGHQVKSSYVCSYMQLCVSMLLHYHYTMAAERAGYVL